MQLSIDLTGRDVLITGSETAARQAVRRYEAAGAVVSRLSTPSGAGHDGPCRSGPSWWRQSRTASPVGRPAGPLPGSRHPRLGRPAAGPAGHVTLVGGGPGTTELLTVAAVNALRDADVVFYDRLAPYQELPSLTSAELVDVGKKPGHHKVSQGEIEKLMVERAGRQQRGPAQGRGPLRLWPWRRGSRFLRRSRRSGQGGVRSDQRHLGARRRRHPCHPPRGQPHVHRGLRPRPADRE